MNPPIDPAENPTRDRYFENLRAYAREENVLYTFDVAGASPWAVFSTFLGGLRRRH